MQAFATHADVVEDISFEIEGNLAFDELEGALYDWENIGYPPGVLITDPHSKSATDFDIFKPAGKFATPEDWSVQDGSVGSAQAELTNILAWAIPPGDAGNTDAWIVLGMERTKKEGTFALDFELNQNGWDGNSGTLVRETGDIAVGFELSGNPTDAEEDLQVLIVVYDPNMELNNNMCTVVPGQGNSFTVEGGTDACPEYGSDTGWYYRFLSDAAILHTSGYGSATMNDVAFFVSDGAPANYQSYDAQGNLDDDVGIFEFAEAAINLSALGLDPGCPGFGSVHAKSRSSLEVGSDLKDLAGPASLPVQCRLDGYKFLDIDADGMWDQGDEPPLEGWEIQLSDGVSTYTETTDLNGYYEFENLADGDYTVSEVCPDDSWVQTAPGATDFAGCGSEEYDVTINLDNREVTDLNFGNGQPAVQIEKLCTADVFIGDDIDYDITVTNIGNVNLSNLVVSDTLLGSLGSIASLAPNQSTLLEPSYLATSAGTVDNTASVAGDYALASVSDSADCSTDVYELTVTKTADEFYSRYFEWDITKSVEPTSWALFDGESGTSDYTVDLDQTGYYENDWQVSGSIMIDNPAPIAASLDSVVDNAGGIPATVVCPALTVPAEDSLECSYDTGAQDGVDANPFGALNTATATLNNNNGGTTDFDGTAPIDFAEATVELVDEEATVSDTFADSTVSGTYTDDMSFSYSRTFTCDADEGQHDNTASFETNDTPLTGSDDASVTVNCYDLTVTKTADEHFTRYYEWDIQKEVDNEGPITLFPGQTADVNYDITVSLVSVVDNDWLVDGSIFIANSHPTRDAKLTLVVDDAGGIAATVSCPSDLVPAGGSLECSYASDVQDSPDANPFGDLNTATATQQLYDFGSDGIGTEDGTKDYSGNEPISFGDPTELVDEEITVNDTLLGFVGTVHADEAPKTFIIPYTITAPSDNCGIFEIPNIADFVTNDTGATGSDDALVVLDVLCLEGCTPGFWQGGAGAQLWDVPMDNDWFTAGYATPYNPYAHDKLFNDFFNVVTHPDLSNYTMYDLVSSGGGSNAAVKAARDMVAAYLNESAFPVTFPADSLDALKAMWYDAVTASLGGDDSLLDAFHTQVNGWNSPEPPGFCPLP
jgi:hypothetical protein